MIPIITYHFNYNFIVKNECVNRDKPWMHCNGKCYLHKELANVFEGNKKAPQKLSLRDFKFSEFTEQKNLLSISLPLIDNKKERSFYHNHYSFNRFSIIFRPPQPGC